MESERTWPLETYSKMVESKWVTPVFSNKGCSDYLHIKGPQLIVVCKNVAVETICLLGGGGHIKVQYSNQSIGMSVFINQSAQSKFKIRFANCNGKSAEDNCLEAVNLLSKFVTVTQHPSHRGRKPAELVTKTMTQVMKDILERIPDIRKTSELILPEKNIAELVQECLLDPGFPALVEKVEDLMENRSGEGF